jgi:peptidoglycan/LPS O-acetylase OafA/YrhL
MWRLSNLGLALVIASAGAVLTAVLVTTGGVDVGWQHDLPHWALGYARVLFSFPLGWLAWRLRDKLAGLCTVRSSWLALAAVVLTLGAPMGGIGSLASVMYIYPLAVVALALGPQPTGWLGRASSLAGALSYPLYATHASIVILAKSALPLPLGYAVGAVATLAVAWIAYRSVEPIGRRALTRMFAKPSLVLQGA